MSFREVGYTPDGSAAGGDVVTVNRPGNSGVVCPGFGGVSSPDSTKPGTDQSLQKTRGGSTHLNGSYVHGRGVRGVRFEGASV